MKNLFIYLKTKRKRGLSIEQLANPLDTEVLVNDGWVLLSHLCQDSQKQEALYKLDSLLAPGGSTPLYTSHNDTRHQVLRAAHDRLAAEQDTHIIKLHGIRLASKPGRVVDAHTILDKRFVAAEIAWLAGIDRYLEKGATSAA